MSLLDPLRARMGLLDGRNRADQARLPASQIKASQSYGQSLLGLAKAGHYVSPIDRGFHHNPIVYRCVRMISEACVSFPLSVREADAPRSNHALSAVLERPNNMQSGADLREALVSHLLLFGNAYLETSGDEGDLSCYALRPDRMRIIADEDGWPRIYEYAVKQRKLRYDIVETPYAITHLKMFHPQNDHYGYAPLAAADLALDIHNAANQWNKSLFDNAARPSGALVYRGQDGANHLTDEQFERLKQELENNFQGAQNAGRPLLLEGGLDWSRISLSPQDMDFIEAKNSAARDIALAFGVPPMLLGIPGDNTYSNYAEANRAFWRQTILPLAARLADALQRSLCRQSGLSLQLDLDAVPALSDERKKLWDRLEKASFLTPDEKREAVGYPPLAKTEAEQ